MLLNKPSIGTIKKVLLVPTGIFIFAVAVMSLGIFFVAAPVTLLGLDEYKQTVRDFYAVAGTVSSVTIPFAFAFLFINVFETN